MCFGSFNFSLNGKGALTFRLVLSLLFPPQLRWLRPSGRSSLAPSALSQIPSYPPRSELGHTRSSLILASSFGQEAHVLPQRGGGGGGPSRATRLSSSGARRATVLSDSGGRSRASLSRGAFAERDAFLASGDQSLADFYEDDLDFDYLGHSQFGGHQPSFGSAPLDCVPDEYKPDDFTGSSPYALSAQAESILCRYLGDLYRINQ